MEGIELIRSGKVEKRLRLQLGEQEQRHEGGVSSSIKQMLDSPQSVSSPQSLIF